MDEKKSLGSNFIANESSSDSSGGYNVTFKNSKKEANTIDRNALPMVVQDFIKNTNGIRRWKTDPEMLYDYSENLIVESFIDTLCKDVSSADYVVNSDKTKEFIKNPHPQKTFNDILEEIVSDLLRTGNAFIVVNRYNNGDIAEIVVPPASTIFKYVDDKGMVQGYVQRIGRNQTNTIDTEDIYHIKWSNRNDREYGVGPTERSLDTIDIIDELTLMEILDLTEGGISKIISQKEAHNLDPMNSQEWNQLKNNFHAQEGARHKNMLAKGSFDATTVTTDYTKFKLLDRYKFHIQKLGSIFKVNPSYVGFDFENSNRATDVSQRESYKQRGIKVTLNMLKDKFRELFNNEFDDNSFDWSIDATSQTGELEYYQKLGEAVQELQQAGVEFNIQDNSIIIPEDADISNNDLQKVQEIKVIDKMSDKDINSIIEDNLSEQHTESKDFESCVESVLNENPDLSEQEAKAICGSKHKDINISSKKEAFTEAFEKGTNFVETLVHLESDCSSRREAINKCKEELGEFSPNTYYKWLDIVGLK